MQLLINYYRAYDGNGYKKGDPYPGNPGRPINLANLTLEELVSEYDVNPIWRINIEESRILTMEALLKGDE